MVKSKTSEKSAITSKKKSVKKPATKSPEKNKFAELVNVRNDVLKVFKDVPQNEDGAVEGYLLMDAFLQLGCKKQVADLFLEYFEWQSVGELYSEKSMDRVQEMLEMDQLFVLPQQAIREKPKEKERRPDPFRDVMDEQDREYKECLARDEEIQRLKKRDEECERDLKEKRKREEEEMESEKIQKLNREEENERKRLESLKRDESRPIEEKRKLFLARFDFPKTPLVVE